MSVLSSAGVSSPQVDAELLAAHVLGTTRAGLVLVAEFPADRLDAYRRLVAARAGRVPLQHLTGAAPFRHLSLAVGPGVFIPRAETEVLVSWGLRVAPARATVVDLCSGSGAIALSVARELPTSTVYAVERDPVALAWLRRNAADSRVHVVAGDVADPTVLSILDGTVDLILANPPYVPAGTAVPPEVDHDPPQALFAGPDGLDVIRHVIACAARLLAPGGWVGIEHDERHDRAVPALLGGDGRFRDVGNHLDLTGRSRFSTARMADFTA